MSEASEVVRYSVEGGFTGLVRSVVVLDDGTVEVSRGGVSSTTRWPVDRVRSLVADLDVAGLFTEDREFTPPSGADLQRYEIAFAGATVVAYDTVVPPELGDVMARLDAALGGG